MSATLDASTIQNFFSQSGILTQHMHITVRTHPVDIYHLAEATPDYILSTLHQDILVFMPTIREIERSLHDTAYSPMPTGLTSRVFVFGEAFCI